MGSSHQLYDTVRGAGPNNDLASNATHPSGGGNAASEGYLSEFESNGFVVTNGSGGANAYWNDNGEKYVAWNFRGGDTVTNNDGSIPTQVSVNKDMGFSVVKWTQNLQQLYTIGHGLGKIPELIITKRIDASQNWEVYSKPTGVDKLLHLNTAQGELATGTWGSFQPTNKVFMFTHAPGNYIAYCFTNTEMLQTGSYAGNGLDDGAFVSLPFKPSFLLIKNTTRDPSNWHMWDSSRDPHNIVRHELYPDLSYTDGTDPVLDFVSNGFKLRTGNPTKNGSGFNYLYLAISEQPFKHARGR